MIRKILVPQERKLVLELPEEFIGKEVEVLAFEVADDTQQSPHTELEAKKSGRLQKIQHTFSKYQVDMSDYKFDRDDANDFD